MEIAVVVAAVVLVVGALAYGARARHPDRTTTHDAAGAGHPHVPPGGPERSAGRGTEQL